MVKKSGSEALRSTLGLCFFDQALLPKLRQARTAKIAIISSMMASRTRAGGHTYAYCASKAAVLNIGRTLAAELRPDAVSVGILNRDGCRTMMGTDQAPLDVSTDYRQLKCKITGLNAQDGGDHPF